MGAPSQTAPGKDGNGACSPRSVFALLGLIKFQEDEREKFSMADVVAGGAAVC